MMIRLPVRQYRCYAPPGTEYDERNFGHVHREMELDPAATALVTVDLWNMGFEPEPLAPELGREAEYGFLGVGLRTAAAAREIVEQRMPGVLQAAREAGLTVVHCNSTQVVRRYPECLVEVNGSSHEPEPKSWPPPEVRQAVLDEYVLHTWGEGADKRWQRMREVCDFPAPIRPQRGDFCIADQPSFDHVMRERKITSLIYMGFLLAHCMQDKPGGLRSTAAIWNSPGYRTIVLRDCTIAQESAESIEGFRTTEAFIFWLEASTIPTATAEGFVGSVGE